MDQSIFALTSLSPASGDVPVQRACIQSWKNAGLQVCSFNHPSEIGALKQSYDVDFVPVTCTSAQYFFGRHYVPIKVMLDWAAAQNSPVILINSDIELRMLSWEIARARWLSDSGLCYFIRHNHSGELGRASRELWGIDGFLLHGRDAALFPPSFLSMGTAFWDYWIPYTFALSDRPIRSVEFPAAYHREHRSRWSLEIWRRCALEFCRINGLSESDWSLNGLKAMSIRVRASIEQRTVALSPGPMKIRQWMEQRFHNGGAKTFLELGAHEGEDTAWMAALPDVTIHAFEPDPRNHQPPRDNVVPHRLAIGDRDGTCAFILSQSGWGRRWTMSSSIKRPKNHLRRHPVTFGNTIEVSITTLDSFCRQHDLGIVDFIWADIQGAEGEMIRGGRETLKRTRFLYTEYSDDELYENQATLQDILEMLPDFRVVELWSDNVLLENKHFPGENKYPAYVHTRPVTFQVVTPSLNCARFIDETIESVISQAGDFLINYHIQDGGSADGTLEVLARWRELIVSGQYPSFCRGIHFSFESRPDNGMYDAIARGFHHLAPALDEMMTWINSDDRLAPGAMSTVAAVTKDLPDVELLGGRTVELSEPGAIISVGLPAAYSNKCIAAGLHDGRGLPFIMQAGTFWRRKIWNGVGGVNTTLRNAGDWDLWRRMAAEAHYVAIDTITGFHRRRSGQLSSDMGRYYLEVDAVLADHRASYNKTSEELLEWCSFPEGDRDDRFFARVAAYENMASGWSLVEKPLFAPPLFGVGAPIDGGWMGVEGFDAPEGPCPDLNINTQFFWTLGLSAKLQVYSARAGRRAVSLLVRGIAPGQIVGVHFGDGRSIERPLSGDIRELEILSSECECKIGWNEIEIETNICTPVPEGRRLGILVQSVHFTSSRLIASLHAAAERARADSEQKERMIASLHAAAMARLDIIGRLEADLRSSLARNQDLEKRLEAREHDPDSRA